MTRLHYFTYIRSQREEAVHERLYMCIFQLSISIPLTSSGMHVMIHKHIHTDGVHREKVSLSSASIIQRRSALMLALSLRRMAFHVHHFLAPPSPRLESPSHTRPLKSSTSPISLLTPSSTPSFLLREEHRRSHSSSSTECCNRKAYNRDPCSPHLQSQPPPPTSESLLPPAHFVRSCVMAFGDTAGAHAGGSAGHVRRWKRDFVAVGEGNQGQANKAKLKMAKWIPVPEDGMWLCVCE